MAYTTIRDVNRIPTYNELIPLLAVKDDNWCYCHFQCPDTMSGTFRFEMTYANSSDNIFRVAYFDVDFTVKKLHKFWIYTQNSNLSQYINIFNRTGDFESAQKCQLRIGSYVSYSSNDTATIIIANEFNFETYTYTSDICLKPSLLFTDIDATSMGYRFHTGDKLTKYVKSLYIRIS